MHKWLDAAITCSGVCRNSDEFSQGQSAGVEGTCVASKASDIGRPCFNMRTGSRYEDLWTLPAPEDVQNVDRAASSKAQNHEYIEGRFGELIFNDTTVQLHAINVGAWVVRMR